MILAYLGLAIQTFLTAYCVFALFFAQRAHWRGRLSPNARKAISGIGIAVISLLLVWSVVGTAQSVQIYLSISYGDPMFWAQQILSTLLSLAVDVLILISFILMLGAEHAPRKMRAVVGIDLARAILLAINVVTIAIIFFVSVQKSGLEAAVGSGVSGYVLITSVVSALLILTRIVLAFVSFVDGRRHLNSIDANPVAYQ